jgi:hypothetical protein
MLEYIIPSTSGETTETKVPGKVFPHMLLQQLARAHKPAQPTPQ